MKSFIVLALFVAAAVAAPASPDADAVITKYESNPSIGVEPYGSVVETSNGISMQQSGQLKNVGTENEALEVRGQYSFVDPQGAVHTITFVANEDGYQASGADIPTAP